ncbi:MAG: hypothetical protein H6813_06820 [Phycisphaeraceae bacterium]|nr:hypothetical protein [Phycisphaeraceae bacterium]MCB9848647.1 hypothetical protein [Phycisphaeraceae bacterium]
MRTKTGLILILAGLGGAALTAPAQQQSVVDSPHNLSATGPGTIRAVAEEQVCIFCHAPHNSTPVRPLWNRAMPIDAYTIYTSRALDAEPGQPTGMSKMCLSCHDGTIALGSVNSRNQQILMSGGVVQIPLGPARLGTDLADDHPISFRFDSSLAANDSKLVDPATLPHEVMLDHNSELQCSTCHDAHNNQFGKFLVLDNTESQLCVICHRMGTTTITAHENCNACHTPHTAPSGPYLLRGQTIAETCLACHDGTIPGAVDILSETGKPSNHETFSEVDPQEPLSSHASCADCHEPHTMTQMQTPAPDAPGSFGMVAGVNAAGSPVAVAQYEYEVCFRCHGPDNPVLPRVPRVSNLNDVRLEFETSAASFHPIEAPGKNMDVPSLLPGITESDIIRCTDCHSSDLDSAAGGSGPDGLHGSVNGPLLVANYTTTDFTSESAEAYALCYLCHDRNSILNDESFSDHRKHIVEKRTPCSACHDAHGISSLQGSETNNSHLINFDTSIVFPDPSTNRLEFRSLGFQRGECYLTCHNTQHSPRRYPED